MKINKHGYTPVAMQLRQKITELRDHVELEKFLCRMLVDNEDTQQFEQNTRDLKNKIFNMRYNNKKMRNLTKAGKKEASETTDGNK